MDVGEILDVSSTCRCCLSQTEDAFDIFASGEDMDVANALQEVCSIEALPGDNLPHVICDICLEVLRTSYKFRVRTLQSNETLRNILNGNITQMRDEMAESPSMDQQLFVEIVAVESDNDAYTSLTCPYCAKTFTHRRNLQIHKQQHFMIGKYGCPACDQRFHTKFDLQRHSFTLHSTEKPFKCEECAKTFPTQPELNRHLKLLHNPVKSFSCSECGMQFKLKANAKQHIHLVHSKERNHVCGVCGKAFAFASKLRVHQRSSKCERSVGISVVDEVISESSQV